MKVTDEHLGSDRVRRTAPHPVPYFRADPAYLKEEPLPFSASGEETGPWKSFECFCLFSKEF